MTASEITLASSQAVVHTLAPRFPTERKTGGNGKLTPRRLRRPRLKRNLIPRNSREMVIPQPAHRLLAGLDPAMLMSVLDLCQPLLLARLVVPLDPARAHDEHVAGPQRQLLVGDDGVEVCDGDFVARHRVVLDAFAVGVGDVVEQNAAADDAAAVGPVWGLWIQLSSYFSFLW